MSAVVKVKQRRADRLGASDAPVVLGLVPTKGPINVWLTITGRQANDMKNDAMLFGTEYEPIIRGRYVDANRSRVWVPDESLLHPEIEFLQATPDGIALKNTAPDIVDPTWKPEREHWWHGLEVKAPRARQRPEWGGESGPESVPAHVLVQCAVQMAVCDLPFVDVAAEIDREYLQRRIHRDRELEADVLEGLAEFWKHVKNDTPPPVDATESYAEYLKKKLEKAAQTIEATPAIEKIVDDWYYAENQLKQAKDRCDLLKNRFMSELVAQNASACKTKAGVIRMQAGKVTYDDRALAQDFANRLQLRGEPVDFDEERARHRKQGDPFPRRPNNWTKE